MLSCQDVTDKLSAQIDGELSVKDRLALRLHQFICKDCRNAATNMRALVLGLRDRQPAEEHPPVSDDYVERVMRALNDEQKP